MPRPKRDRLHDELDALLDGRPVELTEELTPLAEAAVALRAELAAYELDPEVADRHLERVLVGSATVVPMPPRTAPSGWDLRRRAVAVALAAALVIAPATMASAAALPGQAMYPFKLAIEQLRLAAVQWSPAREAVERTRVADERLDELEQLVSLKLFTRVPTAIRALNEAVMAARVAVVEAQEEGAAVAGVAAKLDQVSDQGAQVVDAVAQTPVLLTDNTREAIEEAADESEEVLTPDRQVGVGTTPSPPATSPAPTTTEPPPTTDPTPTSPTTTEPTTTEPPTTEPTTTEPPTTSPPSTDPPTTTLPPEAPSDTGAGGSGAAEDPPAAGGPSPEDVPPTTAGA